jgi:hypothetical protein
MCELTLSSLSAWKELSVKSFMAAAIDYRSRKNFAMQ